MGAVYMIHASITEYLIIFGTPSGTEGHTGLFLADDYFHILVGEQWAFEPGALEKEVYRPGDLHLMRRGVKKQYKMHDGAWAMEYVRGGSRLSILYHNVFFILSWSLIEAFSLIWRLTPFLLYQAGSH